MGDDRRTSFLLFSGGLFSRKQRQKHQQKQPGSNARQRPHYGSVGHAAGSAEKAVVTINAPPNKSTRTTVSARPRLQEASFVAPKQASTVRSAQARDMALPVRVPGRPLSTDQMAQPARPEPGKVPTQRGLYHVFDYDYHDPMSPRFGSAPDSNEVRVRRFSENQYSTPRATKQERLYSMGHGHDPSSAVQNKGRASIGARPPSAYWDDEYYDDDEGPLNPLEVLEEFFHDTPAAGPWFDTALSLSPRGTPKRSAPATSCNTPSQRARLVSDVSFISPLSPPTVLSLGPAPAPTSPPPHVPRLGFPTRLRRNSSVTSRASNTEGKWAELNQIFRTLSNRDSDELGAPSVPIHLRPLPPVPMSPPESLDGRMHRNRPSVWPDSIEEAAEPRREPSSAVDLVLDPATALDADMDTRPPTSPVVAHIIPPKERARIGSSRHDSFSSQSSQDTSNSHDSTLQTPDAHFNRPQPIPSSPFRSAKRLGGLGPVGLTPPPRPLSRTQASSGHALGSLSYTPGRPLSPTWRDELMSI